MTKKTTSAFEATVLTHLEYMRKKQDEHDKILEGIKESYDKQINICDEKFKCINTKMDKTEGFVSGIKGTIIAISTVISVVVGWLISLFQK